MSNKPQNNFDQILEKISELKGKTVSHAGHTYGSMFIFDLDKNTVIVENNNWRLLNNSKEIINCDTTSAEINNEITKITGNKIIQITFDKIKLQLSFAFSNNYLLEIILTEKTHRDLGIKLTNGEWIDIGPVIT